MNQSIINQAKHFYSTIQAIAYVSDPELRDLLYREVLATQATVREVLTEQEVRQEPEPEREAPTPRIARR